MASSIIYCEDNPVKTSLSEWMNQYAGRVSVGRRHQNSLEILAYSDSREDVPALYKMAKERQATYINSVLSEGVTAID